MQYRYLLSGMQDSLRRKLFSYKSTDNTSNV